MPVITFDYEDLYQILGREIKVDKLLKLLPMIGSDIEDYDDEKMKVEFFPNRPDHFSVEGIARTLKGFLDIERGMPEYDLSPSGMTIEFDPKLSGIRPYVACCVVEDVDLGKNKLIQLMEFQEDLHWVIGRDRKKVAIGIHNLDVIKPPFFYKAADPDRTSFVPLECSEKMTLREILRVHKKGRKYAYIVDKFDRYPLIVDSNDDVLSMPPIINGELTQLKSETKNILIDVTGTDEQAVNYTLNIIATSFAEAGGRIKTMKVVYPERSVQIPDLSPKKKNIRVPNAEDIIGVDLTPLQVVDLLSRVRLGAETFGDDKIQVLIPAYRIDVLHEVDIIENIAVGYCFSKIKPELPQIATIANDDKWMTFNHSLREVMTGFGFYEIMSLMLTNEKQHYENMRIPEDDHVRVSQPISLDRSMIRKSLLNGLLEFLEDNQHEELPQRIFEIGDVLYLDENAETCTRTVKKLAGAIIHSKANFTEIKSTVDALVSNLGLKMEIEPLDHPSFIKGRCARIKGVYEVNSKNEVLKDLSSAGSLDGVFGEFHPEVVNFFHLEYPVVAFEVEFTP